MKSILSNHYKNQNLINTSDISNEENLKQIPNYKTELCKTFLSTGKYPYGNKCLFAQCKNELINKHQCKNHKQKPCKSLNEKGFCLYGTRCNFMHTKKKSKIQY